MPTKSHAIGEYAEPQKVAAQPDSWEQYGQRIPRFRERMLKAQSDLRAGKGVVLQEVDSATPR